MNNYHTHTKRCQHAIGSDEDYVKCAIKAGIKVLGFSDHTPWPYKNFKSHMRMEESQLEEYISSVEKLKQQYSNKIELKIGLECEYFPEYMDWLKNTYSDLNIDYLILGVHFYPNDQNYKYMHSKPMDDITLNNYLLSCIKGIETNLFSCLAHPDLFLRFVPEIDNKYMEVAVQIIEKAKEYNMPLEYNLNSKLYKNDNRFEYFNPSDEFWKLVSDYKVQVIIGYDAHYPKFLNDSELYYESKEFLNSIGIKPIKTLEFV